MSIMNPKTTENKGKENNMKYRNTNTGEVFTMDEIRESFEQFRYDMETEYDSFEEYFEAMCDRGDFEEVEED